MKDRKNETKFQKQLHEKLNDENNLKWSMMMMMMWEDDGGEVMMSINHHQIIGDSWCDSW